MCEAAAEEREAAGAGHGAPFLSLLFQPLPQSAQSAGPTAEPIKEQCIKERLTKESRGRYICWVKQQTVLASKGTEERKVLHQL